MRTAQSRRRWLWFAPAVSLMAAIWWFSSLSRLPQLPPGLEWDKLVHAGAYGLLAGLLWVGFTRGGNVASRRAAWMAGVLAAVYGAIDEIHQGFVPLREPDALDLLADGLGAALCGVLLDAGARLRGARKRPGRDR